LVGLARVLGTSAAWLLDEEPNASMEEFGRGSGTG
jgi:hypothetical protein